MNALNDEEMDTLYDLLNKIYNKRSKW
jgi:hypothetical protein